MKTLRVGLFTYGMSQHLTGIGRYAMEMSYALSRVAHSLELILLSPYPASQLPWYQDFPSYPVPELKRLPEILIRGHHVLNRAARKLHLDIVHDPCGIAPFLGRQSPHGRVVTVYDAIPIVHPQYQPLLTKFVFHTLVPGSRWTADAVITVSHHAKSDISDHMGIPKNILHVIPPGTHMPNLVQLQRWKSLVSETITPYGIRRPYFLSVGADNPRKNVAGLVEAFERLKIHHPEASLVMVGPKPTRPKPSVAGVQHLGYVSQDQLDVLYVGATALVFPSFYEGFGIPVLEAMSHGTPVITSNVSSLPEVAGDAAILLDPHNASAIENAMERCLNPDVAAELSLKGRIRALRYGWDEAALHTFNVYQQVAQGTNELK